MICYCGAINIHNGGFEQRGGEQRENVATAANTYARLQTQESHSEVPATSTGGCRTVHVHYHYYRVDKRAFMRYARARYARASERDADMRASAMKDARCLRDARAP